ncbi:hypothetical protein Pcinc_019900 [Petrolisthes cinctipes]|uniref:SWIM-type domain-containing protein n=1 Tax=Petrolisthes cinctipes TaxID=88211 RepID=A0AAE1FKB7_PETCI|nr:hypothetical protein Pcinc_019900 [Petrolisthes cinctipes]
MFLNKHIWKVLVKHVDHGRTFVKGSCTRQTAQTESPYEVWGLLSSGGTIEAAGCQCTGDDGGCKHVVALMFAVADFVTKNGLLGDTPTRTGLPYQWNVPRRKARQELAANIDFRKDTGTQRPFPPRSEYYKSHNSSDSFSSSDLLQEFMAVSGQRSSYAMVLNPPSQGSPREDLLSPVQR